MPVLESPLEHFPKRLSPAWIIGAMSLTAPTRAVGDIAKAEEEVALATASLQAAKQEIADSEPSERMLLKAKIVEARGRVFAAEQSLTNTLAATVVCNDDCEHCPMFTRGCAKHCNRWDDLICKDCPCLASQYADAWGETKTVNHKTNDPVDVNPYFMLLRSVRKGLGDGESIPVDVVDDARRLDGRRKDSGDVRSVGFAD